MPTSTWSIRTSAGETIDLCSGPYHATPGPGIFGPPPIALGRSTRPGLDGSTITGRRWTEKEFSLPVRVKAASGPALRAAVRALTVALAGSADVVIRFDDGTIRREIVATLQTGFDALPIQDDSTRATIVPLGFTASDPLWRSVEEDIRRLSVPLAQTGGAINWDDPLVSWGSSVLWDGWSGTSGQIELPEILNRGDLDAWPRIEVEGPADAIEIVNLSYPGAHVLRLDLELSPNDRVVLDASPRRREIRKNEAITTGAFSGSFFPLVPGPNRLIAVVDGMDEAASSTATITWRERFLSC